MGETINDANDRAIVKCAQYYKIALGDAGEVVFITSDVGNKVCVLLLGSAVLFHDYYSFVCIAKSHIPRS